jgi:hypothetical protein
MYARVPGWISRDRWLVGVDCWLLSAEGEKIRAAHRVDITTVRRIARALADFADHDTGRSCAPSQATIARLVGCSPKTVQRAESILAASKLLTVVHGGGLYHGGMHKQYRELRRAGYQLVKATFCPRIRALSLPRAVHDVQLPAGGRSRFSSLGTQYSPTDAQARRGAAPRPKSIAPTRPAAGKLPASGSQRRSDGRSGRHPAPVTAIRPLALQQLAAAIAVRLPALAHRRHIGALCDALSWAQIEPHRWGPSPTAAANALLTALTKRGPIPTADRMRSPIGWLHAALTVIDPEQPTPYEQHEANRAALRARQDADRAVTATEKANAVPLAESTAAQQIRAQLAALSRRTHYRRSIQ